jgi:hypothetical protein
MNMSRGAKMKKEHALNLISKLLDMASEQFDNYNCNDLDDDFFDGMTKEEQKGLVKEWCAWWGEESEDVDITEMSDTGLMGFFSDYVKTL